MVIFFVVFVMIFNSFAAISVSDGSAFVTKAEFSADLNNLSNRMSALENSIDAKIDSLVSSYLSRNGIWNGEKQTIETSPQNKLKYFFVSMGYSAVNLRWNSNTSANFYLSPANQLTNQATSASNAYRARIDGEGTYTIIKELTKSGLICVNFKYFVGSGPAYNVQEDKWREDNTIGKSGWLSTIPGWGWAANFKWDFIETKQSGEKVGETLNSLFQSFGTNSIVPDFDSDAMCRYVDQNTSFYAFVTKGNQVRLVGDMTGSGTISATSGSGPRIGLVGYGNGIRDNYGTFTTVTVNSASVY